MDTRPGPMPPALDDDEDRSADRAAFLEAGDTDALDHRWWIVDTDDAEWALRTYGDATGRMIEAEAQRKRWHDQIDRWFLRETKADRSTAARMSARLLSWAVAQREADPDRATIILPSGSLPTTFRRESQVVIDEAPLVLEWARENLPAAISTTEKVNVTDLRPYVRIVSGLDGHVVVDQAGAKVPGVLIDPPSITARITLA